MGLRAGLNFVEAAKTCASDGHRTQSVT